MNSTTATPVSKTPFGPIGRAAATASARQSVLSSQSASPDSPDSPASVAKPTDRQVSSLARGAVCSLVDSAGLRLRVLRGRIWLTEAGDPDDYFVCAGQADHRIRSAGRVVCEGDSDSPAEFVLSSRDRSGPG